MTETVTRLRGTASTDRNGNQVTDWTDPDTVDVDGCALAPIIAGEDRGQGRQGVVIGWTLYTPPGADIVPTDLVTARGDTYTVDGEPGDWRNPYTETAAGMELTLRRVEG